MHYLFLALTTLLLVACASQKPAPNAFADAERAIETAVRAGAEEHAPVELRFAREKLDEARKGIEYRQYDKAIVLIEQSEINSELAVEKTRTALARVQFAEASREIEVLREDFEATYGEGTE